MASYAEGEGKETVMCSRWMRTESNGGEEEVGADADHRLRTEARETTSTAAPGRAAVGEEGEVVTASTTEGSGSSKLSYDPTAMANLERRRNGNAADLGEGARVRALMRRGL